MIYAPTDTELYEILQVRSNLRRASKTRAVVTTGSDWTRLVQLLKKVQERSTRLDICRYEPNPGQKGSHSIMIWKKEQAQEVILLDKGSIMIEDEVGIGSVEWSPLPGVLNVHINGTFAKGGVRDTHW